MLVSRWHARGDRLLALMILMMVSMQNAKVVDFEQAGGIAGDTSKRSATKNSILLNSTLATLSSGDTLLIPNKTFTYLVTRAHEFHLGSR